jgi:hypothetical protein
MVSLEEGKVEQSGLSVALAALLRRVEYVMYPLSLVEEPYFLSVAMCGPLVR